MNPLYSLAIGGYALAVKLAAFKSDKARRLLNGQEECMARLEKWAAPGSKVVWVHAASLGEFEQGRPLMEKIRAEHPEYKILLTFFSPSGYDVRRNWDGADCVCCLPFDTPARVRKFVEVANPNIAVFVKYEIWRNYLEVLHKRNIPTYLISAAFRKTQRFFKWWGAPMVKWLSWFSEIFVQDEGSKKLLNSVGIDRVTVAGDTRFDRVASIREAARKIPQLEAFRSIASEGLMMAGSSWPQDEEVYLPWINEHPEVKLVIAPHEFDSRRLEFLRKKCINGAVLLSECDDEGRWMESNPQVLIIDCFGLLSSAYAYCSVAYVGGGFGVGIHNINEPAVYGVPVIYGPNNAKFIEAREMAASGGGFPIASQDDFRDRADLLFGDETARKKAGDATEAYIKSKLGATRKVYSKIFG